MTPAEIAIIETTLKSMPEPVRIFEYGAGYSTIYFPHIMKNLKREYLWHSVESSLSWYKFVCQKLQERGLEDGVQVHPFPAEVM